MKLGSCCFLLFGLIGLLHLLIFRYDELKLLSGELETDAGRAALNADRAYQDSQLLLGSLARLPKVDPSIIQVRNLGLDPVTFNYFPKWGLLTLQTSSSFSSQDELNR